MKPKEVIVGITWPYTTGKDGSLVFVILKEGRKLLRVEKGQPWRMKVDPDHGRIIYEFMKGVLK